MTKKCINLIKGTQVVQVISMFSGDIQTKNVAIKKSF